MFNFPENFYSDIRIERYYKTLIRFEMGKLEEVKTKSDEGAFIRLFDGSRWFYSSTSELNNINNELEALARLASSSADPDADPVTRKMQVNTGKYLNFASAKVSEIDLETKIALVKSYADLVKNDNEITHWSSSYSDSYSEKHIVSSIGTNVKFDSQIAGIRLGFRFGSGANVFSETWCKALDQFKGLLNLHVEASEHISKARNFFKHAEKIEGGLYPVVLSPMAAGIFAHESFGHKSEADFMIGDETMIREWQIGKKVGSDVLSIIDDGNIAGSGFTPFDDEGSKASRTVLIDHGILAGRLHSASTAASLDEAVTGNARSIGFEYEPIVRMTATFIEAGKTSREELFSGVKRGIFIDSVKHGSGMSTFTLAPSMAYLIEDGRITRPVKFSVITGNVMKTLDQIDAVSNDFEILSFVGGGCGKMEQYPLPVSFGGPYVRVKEINVQ